MTGLIIKDLAVLFVPLGPETTAKYTPVLSRVCMSQDHPTE
jgi:hypothetical protein